MKMQVAEVDAKAMPERAFCLFLLARRRNAPFKEPAESRKHRHRKKLRLSSAWILFVVSQDIRRGLVFFERLFIQTAGAAQLEIVVLRHIG